MTAVPHLARTIDFRYAPPVVFTSICRPDDPYKTLVRQDGALLYDFQAPSFESWHFRRVIEFRLRSRGGPQKIRQVTESARVPVVVISIDYPRATLTMRAFGHQDDRGRRTDVVLWEVTAHETPAGQQKAAKGFLAQFKVEIYENGRIFAGRSPGPVRAVFSLPLDAAPPSYGLDLVTKTWAEDTSAPAPGPIVLVSDPQPLSQSHTDGFRPATALAAEPTVLAPGESLRGAIMAPANHGDYDHLNYGWAVGALEEERAFWNGLPQLDLPFSVPDTSVISMPWPTMLRRRASGARSRAWLPATMRTLSATCRTTGPRPSSCAWCAICWSSSGAKPSSCCPRCRPSGCGPAPKSGWIAPPHALGTSPCTCAVKRRAKRLCPTTRMPAGRASRPAFGYAYWKV